MSNPNAMSALSGALATRLKMQLALTGLTVVPESMDEDLDKWLESVPLPPDFPDGLDAELGVSLAANLRMITWRAAGHPSGYIPKLAKYFSDIGVSPVDIGRINDAGEGLRPNRIGSWIRIRDGLLIRGWCFPDELQLSRVLPHAQSNDSLERIAEWAKRHGLETCTHLGRSVGDAPFTELIVPAGNPDVSAVDQLARVLEAHGDLGAPALPEAALAALREAASISLSLSVNLTVDGVSKIGVVVSRPGGELARQLGAESTAQQVKTRDQVEGVLEIESPDAVECEILDGEYGVEYHYMPRISTTSPPKRKREAKNLPS